MTLAKPEMSGSRVRNRSGSNSIVNARQRGDTIRWQSWTEPDESSAFVPEETGAIGQPRSESPEMKSNGNSTPTDPLTDGDGDSSFIRSCHLSDHKILTRIVPSSQDLRWILSCGSLMVTFFIHSDSEMATC